MQITSFHIRPVQFSSRKPVIAPMQTLQASSVDGDSVHFSGLLNRSSKTIDQAGRLIVSGKHPEAIAHKGAIVVKKGAEITGGLTSEMGITLEKNAVVKGDVKAAYLRLGEKAKVNGNVVLDGDLRMKPKATITGDVSATESVTLEQDAAISGKVNSETHVALEKFAKTGDIEAFSATLEPGAVAGDIMLPESLSWGTPTYMEITLRSRNGVAAEAGNLSGYNIRLDVGCRAKNIQATGPVQLGWPNGAAHAEDITTPDELRMRNGSTAKHIRAGRLISEGNVTFESYTSFQPE